MGSRVLQRKNGSIVLEIFQNLWVKRQKLSFNRWSCRFILPWFCRKLSLRKNQFIAFLDFRVMGSLYREAWFCRKTSLTVELITDEAGAFSEVRTANVTKR